MFHHVASLSVIFNIFVHYTNGASEHRCFEEDASAVPYQVYDSRGDKVTESECLETCRLQQGMKRCVGVIYFERNEQILENYCVFFTDEDGLIEPVPLFPGECFYRNICIYGGVLVPSPSIVEPPPLPIPPIPPAPSPPVMITPIPPTMIPPVPPAPMPPAETTLVQGWNRRLDTEEAQLDLFLDKTFVMSRSALRTFRNNLAKKIEVHISQLKHLQQKSDKILNLRLVRDKLEHNAISAIIHKMNQLIRNRELLIQSSSSVSYTIIGFYRI